ncbi:hypothetical protein F383_13683 [Gossypium arboreum]|uniref:Uncharacterized protein n=1 Tax=Gossypium arboreum TaxID=29729 RepID=A0A0B0NDU3_GOSAR|nr:hypothetical protein F383_13683 [Gossypium arboreum]
MYRTTPCWFKYVMMYMCTAMRKWLVIVKYQLKLFAVCIYIYGVMM